MIADTVVKSEDNQFAEEEKQCHCPFLLTWTTDKLRQEEQVKAEKSTHGCLGLHCCLLITLGQSLIKNVILKIRKAYTHIYS